MFKEEGYTLRRSKPGDNMKGTQGDKTSKRGNGGEKESRQESGLNGS